jgi:hypothetical protein
MGQKQLRRQAFFRDHPLCCFCGGLQPSAQEDHFPSRSLFDQRKWPEGYVFPACDGCNQVTRYDEQLVSFLSRFRSNPETAVRESEFRDTLRSIRNNFPGLLEVMTPDFRDAIDAAKKYSLQVPADGTAADLPIMKITDERIHNAVANFARKLGLAIYYKDAGQILPPGGAIGARWYSNVQIDNNEIPRELAEVLPSMPKFERASRSLVNQFFYRVGVTDDKRMATFLAFFRQSFCILGFISTDESELSDLPVPFKVGGPYEWPVSTK